LLSLNRLLRSVHESRAFYGPHLLAHTGYAWIIGGFKGRLDNTQNLNLKHIFETDLCIKAYEFFGLEQPAKNIADDK